MSDIDLFAGCGFFCMTFWLSIFFWPFVVPFLVALVIICFFLRKRRYGEEALIVSVVLGLGHIVGVCWNWESVCCH